MSRFLFLFICEIIRISIKQFIANSPFRSDYVGHFCNVINRRAESLPVRKTHGRCPRRALPARPGLQATPVSSSPAFMKASSAQQRLPQGQEVCSSHPCTDSPHVCLNSGPSSNPPSELRTGLAPVDTGLQWAGQGQDHGIKLQRKLEARGADATNLREKLNSECQTLHVSRERRGRGQTERPSPGWRLPAPGRGLRTDAGRQQTAPWTVVRGRGETDRAAAAPVPVQPPQVCGCSRWLKGGHSLFFLCVSHN